MEKTLYPKTQRIKNWNVVITEKLDWSNLWIFKIWGELIIAQRNNVFKLNELNSNNAYKWLIGWLNENKDKLDLHEWSWVFWEWIWMAHINYNNTNIDKRFYIFAKANIDENLDVRNINYDRNLFIYPFESKNIPDCVWIVPLINYAWPTDIKSLDELYISYCECVWRQVEWFIINNNNQITKYVRYKNWILTEHKENMKD